MSWRAHSRIAAALAAAVLGLAGLTASAAAETLVPARGSVYLGVSDGGSAPEFNEFASLTGKHPALLETFHPWGNTLAQAYERWRATETRPILHISTADDQTLAELFTPAQIATGKGDDYLLQVNRFFASRGLPGYIRPLGEPNRCLNAWSGVNCDGSLRGGEHSRYWYKQAFRRIAAIVRGGASVEAINATLAGLGLPGVNRTKGPNPNALPAAPVSMVWSPLPGGSPRVRGNFPGNYWPGGRWVDWVGTDFYSRYPVWRDLNRFYRAKTWRNKPVAVTEWAVSGRDDPRFVNQIVAWTAKRPRVRMFVYYDGVGPGNQYDIRRYPRTLNTLRLRLRRPAFLPLAEPNAANFPPLPPEQPK
jgi:hypothetical protein